MHPTLDLAGEYESTVRVNCWRRAAASSTSVGTSGIIGTRNTQQALDAQKINSMEGIKNILRVA